MREPHDSTPNLPYSEFDLEYAQYLDELDPLSGYREAFVRGESDLLYMDGNSLGRLPVNSAAHMDKVIQHEWGERLIRSWNEGWLALPQRVGSKIAPLIGASPHEVVLADTTSVNLYKLVIAALQNQSKRTKIITDDLNFPSDLYVLEGAIKTLGNKHQTIIIPSLDAIHGPEAQIIDAIDEQTALVTLSHTTFKSGYVYDMERITQAAHRKGALVLWDLSHSVGVMSLQLSALEVDLAVGCTYKYLNGGPGAPAFLYVNQALIPHLHNPIQGWMGQKNMFDFGLEYIPQNNIARFVTGTPPILSASMVEKGVELVAKVGMQAIRAKSVAQTAYLVTLWNHFLRKLGFTLNSPSNANYRGSHVSLGHSQGLSIDLALINERNIIPDFRSPDNIRIGISPLYISFVDIYQVIQAMKEIVENDLHHAYLSTSRSVT